MANSIPAQDGYKSYLKQSYGSFQLAKPHESVVMGIMKKQQPKLSCGVDTINNKLVKHCCKELAFPMAQIIDLSIEEATVPKKLKIARIIPLYKKGAANECGNYRPVSLLSALSKILEKAICSQLMSYLESDHSLCHDQYGFRPKSQTTHVVHKLLNIIQANSIKNEVTIVTFLDLSKAFDCLQYDKLFFKMEKLGFHEHTIKWFKSYLSLRQQCTDLDGTLSDWMDVELGVPQGSILGPILFLIYVNDINNCDNTARFVKFADDTTVITSAPTLKEATWKMNGTLIRVSKWFRSNKLNLNPSKTRYMIFNGKGTTETELVQIDDQYIERVWKYGAEKSFKLVGIQIDEQLKWEEHITCLFVCLSALDYCFTLEVWSAPGVPPRRHPRRRPLRFTQQARLKYITKTYSNLTYIG